jgi:hypothetical protein
LPRASRRAFRPTHPLPSQWGLHNEHRAQVKAAVATVVR